jgi:hypothetical protein
MRHIPCWVPHAVIDVRPNRVGVSLYSPEDGNSSTGGGGGNSMARVRERTIPIERPPLVGEVIANFCE